MPQQEAPRPGPDRPRFNQESECKGFSFKPQVERRGFDELKDCM